MKRSLDIDNIYPNFFMKGCTTDSVAISRRYKSILRASYGSCGAFPSASTLWRFVLARRGTPMLLAKGSFNW